MTNDRTDAPANCPTSRSKTLADRTFDCTTDRTNDRPTDRPVAPPPRSLPHHSDRRNRRWVAALSSGFQLLMWCLVGW
ncbi:MAG: hypothetical protein EA001_08930 [Oscillatoriales cyanobacterium]|nr:MAG: hypothetical protein EA001_08930 [Oscillatoriales cyanobacterium]